MKTFVVSLLIFGVLLALTAYNSLCINRVVGEIEEALEAMTFEERATDTAAVRELWERHRGWIGLSVSVKDLSAFDRSVAELCCDTWDNESDFVRCLVNAKCAAADLRRLEHFSPENIL